MVKWTYLELLNPMYKCHKLDNKCGKNVDGFINHARTCLGLSHNLDKIIADFMEKYKA